MTKKIQVLMAMMLIGIIAACGGTEDGADIDDDDIESIEESSDGESDDEESDEEESDEEESDEEESDEEESDEEEPDPVAELNEDRIPAECFDSNEAFAACDEDGLLPDDCFDEEGSVLAECEPGQSSEAAEPEQDSSDSESTVEAGPNAITSGFDPSVDAFSFENYGEEAGATGLTAPEMQRMFGDQVCANVADGCTLSPPARQWMEQMNKGMGGGHCEGMAVLSSLFYYGVSSPTDFGADVTGSLDINGNDALQREIAYWWVTQVTEPGGTMKVNESPSVVVDTLIESFSAGVSPDEFWALGIYQPDFSGGHAITPFAVEERGDGVVDVLVYDNNFPSETRVLTVDRNAETWKYVASTNPDEEASLYEGDATTQTLEIVAISPRLQPQVGSFEDSAGPQGYSPVIGQNSNSIEVWLDGDANLLITAQDGRRVGWLEDGSFVNEIDGASSTNLRFGVAVWDVDQEPVYVIPGDVSQFTVTVDGSQLTETGTSNVTMIGSGFNMVVDDLVLDPGQQDTIFVDITSDEFFVMNYESEYSDSPDLWFGIATDEADYEFIVRGSDIEPGGSFNLALDYPNGDFILNTSGQAEFGLYDLLVARIDDDGEYIFSTEDIELLPDDTLYVNFFEWEGEGSPMFLDFDYGTDGTLDDTLVLEDEAGDYAEFFEE